MEYEFSYEQYLHLANTVTAHNYAAQEQQKITEADSNRVSGGSMS